jgi:hypothetical protein
VAWKACEEEDGVWYFGIGIGIGIGIGVTTYD